MDLRDLEKVLPETSSRPGSTTSGSLQDHLVSPKLIPVGEPFSISSSAEGSSILALVKLVYKYLFSWRDSDPVVWGGHWRYFGEVCLF